jgi:signal transduction histidine kinase
MQAMMRTTRRWSIWGLVAGALMGVGDLTVFLALGLEMRLAGRSVMTEVMVLFMVTYGVLGFVIGKLMEARVQARTDAQTIASQLHALEASQRVALQNEKLAAIGRLAAGIAHEVRNPLGVIRASASLVQEHFSSQDEAYRACDFIRAEIDRLNGLITTLLTFSRPAELRLQATGLTTVIDRAFQLTSDELQRRDISLAREENSLSCEVVADPDLVTQVVFSLLLNAAEAIGQHGRIAVRTFSDQANACVEVVDSGPGVGLPMAARIIRAHGGTIEVVSSTQSKTGENGARFRIRLPLAGPPAQQEYAA